MLKEFGLDVQDLTTMFINSPFTIYEGNNSEFSNYNGTQTFNFDKDQFIPLNFTVFPNASHKGFNDTVYMYISDEAPANYPTYTLKSLNYVYNPSKNPNGITLDFIESTDIVEYSLDGTNYSTALNIKDPGTYNVSFRVTNNNSLSVTGTEIVTVSIGDSVIAFDSSKFITNPVHIFSNDNNLLVFYTGDMKDNMQYVDVINRDTLTSLDDTYLVYTNMIKNAHFYDSITKESIDATVVVSEKKENSANFNYTISALGYETINGVVKFQYSELGFVSNSFSQFEVNLPTDYEVSLNDVSVVVPGRPYLSVEDDVINYQTYYSIDDGATWSVSSPKLSAIGEYNVYTLYCFVDQGNDVTDLVDGPLNSEPVTSLASSGNFIITIQKITITE